MKNIQKDPTKYFVTSALLILVFGPTFAFGVFTGPPVYSNETGSAENQEKDGGADKTGTINQFGNEDPGPEKFADQGEPDRNENSSSSYK